MAELWNPDCYDRFKKERTQPFYDLLGYVKPHTGMSVLDLGCGTGALTRDAHTRLGARSTYGIDSSPAMLAKAPQPLPSGLTLGRGDIATFETGSASYDLILSNAALHWLPAHEALFARVSRWLSPTGQLAVQMPANEIHASHRVANEVAAEEPFVTALGGYRRETPVLDPAAYRTLMRELGFKLIRSEYRTYKHVLESSTGVVEWVKGTLLTDFERRMPADTFVHFIARYSEALVDAVGEWTPYTFEFRRVFVWGHR